jgi:hypothetical protein
MSSVPTAFDIERVRTLGDEHPANELEEREFEGEYAELDDKERKDLQDYRLAWFVVEVLRDAPNNKRDEMKAKLNEELFAILSLGYDELHFAHEEDDSSDQLHNITLGMLNKLLALLGKETLKSIFDRVFEAVHPAHNDETRDDLWIELGLDEDDDDVDVGKLPDEMMARNY